MLHNKINELQIELDIQRRRIEELIYQNKKYEEEIRELRLAQAFSGNQAYKRLMKSKINAIVREVDACIAMLKNDEQ